MSDFTKNDGLDMDLDEFLLTESDGDSQKQIDADDFWSDQDEVSLHPIKLKYLPLDDKGAKGDHDDQSFDTFDLTDADGLF